MNLHEIEIRIVNSSETEHFQELMEAHHYLGAIPKISETLRYVATYNEEWVALLSFSAAALKCSARDRWIGWNFRFQYDRLKLITNNSRFLILPGFHFPNLASRVLSLCEKRLPVDWQERFGHPVLLIETFVEPEKFQGTIYKAANWIFVGTTKGFQRTRNGYEAKTLVPKMIFVKPILPNAQKILSHPNLEPIYHTGSKKTMLSAEHMKSLPDFFKDINDPRRSQGQRHRLPTVLAIAAGAVLCGMEGYQAIHEWAKNLGQKARKRFGCRRENKRYIVPSLYVIRDLLIRVDPIELDQALQRWNEAYALDDNSLAIDGKTMCNAIDDQGFQTHIMSAIGHDSKICYTQKK